jgi:hypothetical protein
MPADGGLLGPVFPEDDLPLRSFVSLVRAFMRDYPELNRLIQGSEHSDRMIAWAIMDALSDFNTTPPLIGPFQLSHFPSKHILLRGTVISLLESLGMLMTRNQLTFSDGGIQVGISDKSNLLMSWISLFTNKYEEKKKLLKISLNIEGGWGGGVHSEYMWVNDGFYGGW